MLTNDKLKNRVQISSSVDKVLWAKFQELARESRIPISKRLDEALEKVLRENGKI